MRIRTILFAFATLAIAGEIALLNGAIASSPAAWAQHKKEVIATCLKTSGFRNAKPVGEIVTFNDEIGYDALQVQGNYPEPHMNNQAGKVLCLFDRRTRKAQTQEMK
ncbi:hypothetical protein [Phormidesmis priestleyi]